MRIDILTLFPDLVDRVLSESIIGRGRAAGLLDIRAHNIRDYSEDKHRRVDDTPCGGGRGMLMAAPPIINCYRAVLSEQDFEYGTAKVIYMSPRGKTLTQEYARELAEYDRLVILCGHYEGVDQRALDIMGAEELSVGDYVLTGGELPACILADCVGRLIPGVLPEEVCHLEESFEDNLLEYPQYTRPVEFMGMEVPEVLLSGHHANIAAWRRQQAEIITEKQRPDLYKEYLKSKETKKKTSKSKK